MPLYQTTLQVAAELGIHYSLIFSLLRSGKFPRPHKIGRDLLWRTTDVDSLRRALTMPRRRPQPAVACTEE